MSASRPWILEPTREAVYVIPWLETKPPADLRRCVLEYLASVVADPVRPYIEEQPNVYAAIIPCGHDLGIIYSLDWDTYEVLLIAFG